MYLCIYVGTIALWSHAYSSLSPVVQECNILYVDQEVQHLGLFKNFNSLYLQHAYYAKVDCVVSVCAFIHRGILPFSDRKLAMMQAQDSTNTSGSASSGVGAKQEPITVGRQICCHILIALVYAAA